MSGSPLWIKSMTVGVVATIQLAVLAASGSSDEPRAESQTPVQGQKADDEARAENGEQDGSPAERPRPKRSLGGSGTVKFLRDETSVINLLFSEVVHKEIGLTDEQFQRIDRIYRRHAEGFAPLMLLRKNARPRGLGPEALEAIQAEMDARQAQLRDMIFAQLSRRQVERLKQIAWQNAGLHALLDPEVAARLNLSDAQRVAIQAVLKEMDQRAERIESERHRAFWAQHKDFLEYSEAATQAARQGIEWEQEAPVFRKPERATSSDSDDAPPPAAQGEEQARTDPIQRWVEAAEANREWGSRRVGRLLTSRQRNQFRKLLGPEVDEGQEDRDL